jgi:hypothetical protein
VGFVLEVDFFLAEDYFVAQGLVCVPDCAVCHDLIYAGFCCARAAQHSLFEAGNSVSQHDVVDFALARDLCEVKDPGCSCHHRLRASSDTNLRECSARDPSRDRLARQPSVRTVRLQADSFDYHKSWQDNQKQRGQGQVQDFEVEPSSSE